MNRRHSIVVAAICVGTSLSLGGTANATPPLDVDIEVQTSFSGVPAPFFASGPAVDEGVICDAGVVVDERVRVNGAASRTGFNVKVIKHFICDNGSGEFFVGLQARIETRDVDPAGDSKVVTAGNSGYDLFAPRTSPAFTWNVLSGTGDYVNLHGAGIGNGLGGEPCGDPSLCVLDVYDGRFHVD